MTKNQIAYLKEITWQKEILTLLIKLAVPDKDKPTSVTCVLQGDKNSVTLQALPSENKDDAEGLFITLNFAFNDDTFKDLVADCYLLNLSCHFKDNETLSTAIHAENITIRRHAYGNYYYRIIASAGQAALEVSLKWPWYESNRISRKFNKVFIYPFLRLLPLKETWIIFEEYWGRKYQCNPRAFYEFMQLNHPEYTCIWSFCDEKTAVKGQAIRVRRNSLSYYYYLARAKYLMDNVNFPNYFKKRKGQIYIQTMHGTPLKTMGLDVPGELDSKLKRKRFIKRNARWDYLVVQNELTAKLTAHCFAFRKEYLRVGYPRNDVLFAHNNPRDICAIKRRLGLDPDKKVIMYAPTYRIRGKFTLAIDIAEFKEKLAAEYTFILRVHHFARPGLDKRKLDDYIHDFSDYSYVEDLYLIADIVITDYSSLMFDYAILKRPMLFYTYDLAYYRDTLRGFNFDFLNEAPGPLLADTAELIDSILHIDTVKKEYAERYRQFAMKFNEYEHGNASERIYQRVFLGKKEKI